MKKTIFVVLLALFSMGVHAQAPAKKCQGITLTGQQCKRNAAEGSNFCWQHDPKTPRCGAPLKKPAKGGRTSCAIVVSQAGKRCRHHQ